jgi:hypothetical protein
MSNVLKVVFTLTTYSDIGDFMECSVGGKGDIGRDPCFEEILVLVYSVIRYFVCGVRLYYFMHL